MAAENERGFHYLGDVVHASMRPRRMAAENLLAGNCRPSPDLLQ